MEEMIAMERRKVAYGKKFSLQLAPMSPSIRFNLMQETNASLDTVLINGKCCNFCVQSVQLSLKGKPQVYIGLHLGFCIAVDLLPCAKQGDVMLFTLKI